MGNQLRALESGIAVARVLQRMLVIPNYISDNGEGDLLLRFFIYYLNRLFRHRSMPLPSLFVDDTSQLTK